MIVPTSLSKELNEKELTLLVEAVKASQSVKAVLLCDPSISFEKLPEQESSGLLVAMYQCLLANKQIRSPEQLHKLHVSAQLKSGWTYAENFDFDGKTSPSLCAYDQLPDQLKAFVTHQKIVLDGLSQSFTHLANKDKGESQ